MLVRYRHWIATGANRFIGIITIKSFDVTNDNHNNVFLLSEFLVLTYIQNNNNNNNSCDINKTQYLVFLVYQ